MRVTTSASSRKKTKKAGFLTAVFLAGFGYAMSFFTSDLIEETKASENWPSVPGTVAEATIDSYVSKSDGKSQTMYTARVAVDYSVDGARYSTSSFDMAGGSSTSVRTLARRKLDRYPVGGTVDVFYDPDHPDFGILEPGMTPLFQILRFTPIVLYVLAGIVLVQSVLRVLGVVTALGFLAAKRGKASGAVSAPSASRDAAGPAVPQPVPPGSPEPDASEPAAGAAPPAPGDSEDGFSI